MAKVGFVAQDTPLYPRLTVSDHLRLGAHLNPSWDDAAARSRIEYALVVYVKMVQKKPYMDVRLFAFPGPSELLVAGFYVPASARASDQLLCAVCRRSQPGVHPLRGYPGPAHGLRVDLLGAGEAARGHMGRRA